MKISGTIVDVVSQRTFGGDIIVKDGTIAEIRETGSSTDQFILPGFVDAHVHIESSMLPPTEFARLAVPHGTIATVSDPHEIANVLGVSGVQWMIANAKRSPLKIFFGAPSCVPATNFETAGAKITSEEVDTLLSCPDIYYLSEMMNFPGVLHEDPEVMAKINSAKHHKKVIDGHAPGLRGSDAARYASYGISTDHECSTADEARDKIATGMRILIREGSAAKNFDALIDLIDEFPDRLMFCSDDKHPNDLIVGHINDLVVRALRRGKKLFHVLRAATYNPVKHYSLPVGLLQPGDPADFIVVKNLESFPVLATYIRGEIVASGGRSNIAQLPTSAVNNFCSQVISPSSLLLPGKGKKLRAIKIVPEQLITEELIVPAVVRDGFYEADVSSDILKLVVLNRYRKRPPAVAFVSGFGIQEGAIASTVAHDSHNIVAAGTSDVHLARAMNLLIEHQGGISIAQNESSHVLPLPIAGLMSTLPGEEVAALYESLDKKAKALGSTLPAPFMTLSFLALLVIPALKLSDQGLFDGRIFSFCPLEA